MDAIAVVKADHRTVDQLFTKFEAASSRALKTKRALVDKMIVELSRHAAIEEQIFYPPVHRSVPDLNDDVLEGIEEHHVVKWTLSELSDLAPEAENFSAKVTVLIESVRHHVKEEEKELFPKVRKELTRQELMEMGEQLTQSKKSASTRPRPRLPANALTGAVAGAIDRARDAGATALGR